MLAIFWFGTVQVEEERLQTKAESVSRKRKGKREYLNGIQTRELMKQLDCFFETTVEVPRIKIGKKQTIETLINEEALLLARFSRDERKTWSPRLAVAKALD